MTDQDVQRYSLILRKMAPLQILQLTQLGMASSDSRKQQLYEMTQQNTQNKEKLKAFIEQVFGFLTAHVEYMGTKERIKTISHSLNGNVY
jgi:hypothetical protein